MNSTASDKLVDPDSGHSLPAVMTFEQAHEVFKNFLTDNRDRNNKNAAIARKLNSEQPWSPKKLKSSNQSWRSNRPTGFMSSLMKRLTPPYKQMVDQLALLTYSRFPHESLGADRERDIFRKKITDTLRAWSGWSDFVQQLIDEDICYGYAAVGRKDEYSWKPKIWRSDEAMFYVGCPQRAEECKVWVLKEDFYVDEIVAILEDPVSAAAAGWHVQKLAKQLNGAGQQFDDRANEENARVYEDLIRENNLSATFSSTIRVIKAGHVFAVNPQGGVDHYIIERQDGTALFFRRNRFAGMEEVLTLFSAEVGDRTLHGSRGAGKILYNTHVSVEQARNLVQDALHLSGLLLLKRTQKSGAGHQETPGLTVNHPFAIVGDGYEVLESVKFEINAEAFLTLDQHATAQAEVLIGAFMPGQTANAKGQKRTASEVNYVASVDAQIRAGTLARFADQFFSLVDQLQRRICSPEIIQFASQVVAKLEKMPGVIPVFDPSLWRSLEKAQVVSGFTYFEVPKFLEQDAVQAVVEMLLEKLSPTQILVLAQSSSRANVEDAIASQSGILDLVVARYAIDPVVDTTELKRRDISAKLGADAAVRLMNVDLNPLSDIKQQRQQLQELTTMMLGNDTPVDPTDNDVLHLNVISSRIAPMIQDKNISPLTTSQEFLKHVVTHTGMHLQAAQKKGVKPDQLAQATQMLGMLQKYVQLQPMDQQAAQIVAQATGGGGVPATSLAQDAPEPRGGVLNPVAPAPVLSPNQVITDVANPVRPGIQRTPKIAEG
jgi:hypothetical protein